MGSVMKYSRVQDGYQQVACATDWSRMTAWSRFSAEWRIFQRFLSVALVGRTSGEGQ